MVSLLLIKLVKTQLPLPLDPECIYGGSATAPKVAGY